MGRAGLQDGWRGGGRGFLREFAGGFDSVGFFVEAVGFFGVEEGSELGVDFAGVCFEAADLFLVGDVDEVGEFFGGFLIGRRHVRLAVGDVGSRKLAEVGADAAAGQVGVFGVGEVSVFDVAVGFFRGWGF